MGYRGFYPAASGKCRYWFLGFRVDGLGFRVLGTAG